MGDRLKELLQRFLEWWNKFTGKQKTLIISVIAGVILALAILATVLTRPQYTTLIKCETTKQASDIIALLDGEAIPYQVTDDGLIISVEKENLSSATLLLGANGYPAQSYSLESALSGGFSTTESDKAKTYKLYQEQHLQEIMKSVPAVTEAYVTLSIPENDGTLLAEKEEAYASVMLDLNEQLENGVAENFAKNIATALGNKTTENITIIDSNGNLLYSGADEASDAFSSVKANTQIQLKNEAEKLVKQEVTQVLLGSNLYEEVKVATNLKMDFSSQNETTHTYTQADENGTNVVSHQDSYKSEGSGQNGGDPGTATNTNENEYVIEEQSNSNYSVNEESTDYLPGEKITDKATPPGNIDYSLSSVAVTASHYVIYKEDELKSQGLLDGISFAEFKAENSEMVKKVVEEDMVTLVSNATGIPVANISIIAYDVPLFQASEGLKVEPADIAQIVLIVLILALLAFVVISSLRREKEEVPEEEELSVEELLESTQEAEEEMEDIELESKSEVRLLVEKFVDENPDAAAALLRNWLTDEWG
ncbi:MAG: flagellar M-ring protein FliF [Lachnospiraceae bacterium]|nr:flagellar M-ring protein FliF [Lachnospiraceae bacterium]